MLNSIWPKNVIAKISILAGIKHISIAGRPTFFRSLISTVSPALIRITISAICLSSEDIFKISSEIKFKV